MADERLVAALGSWLQDHDVSPPDTPMSASRVMAGIEVTGQLGRMWPPARLAPEAKPAPALGDFGPEGPPPRPVPRAKGPRFRKVREVATPVRVLSIAVLASLVGGAVLISASLMPSGQSPAAAVVPVASPAPTTAPTTTPTTTPTAMPGPTPEPTPTPFPTWAPSDRALDWHGGGVRLEANALALRVRNRLFNAPGEVLTKGTTARDHAQLESTWYEGDVEQRMLVVLGLDDTHWWIRKIRTYDGNEKGAWVDFADLAAKTRTSLGDPLQGDLQLQSTGAQRKALRKDGSADLRLDGLRLTAFGPGTRPAPLTDCEYWSGPPLQDPGGPLEGLAGMTPAEAEAALRVLGLCFRFDYSWGLPEPFEDARLNRQLDAGRERRCSAPPTGVVQGVSFLQAAPSVADGATVIVEVVDDEVRDLPEPPPAGTDCPAL